MAEDFLNLPSKSGQDIANLALQQIANTLGVTTDALASAVNLANTAGNNANAKILDLETRWNDLTTKQQQDAEVIDARKGKPSLKAKIDELESQSNDIATDMLKEATIVNLELLSGFEATLSRAFKKNGWVDLTFNALKKSNGGEIPVDTYLMLLPVGLRPKTTMHFLGMEQTGATREPLIFKVFSTGQVAPAQIITKPLSSLSCVFYAGGGTL